MKRKVLFAFVSFMVLFAFAFVLTSCNKTTEPTENSGTIDVTPTNPDDPGTYDNVFYTITFKDYDGTVLQTSSVKKGETPAYNKSNPSRENDDNYSYTFSGWQPTLAKVSEDAIYTATYTSQSLPYTRSGNKIYFGCYPQTKVTATTENGLLSIIFDSSTWTSYRYYIESAQSDFMYYKDVDIDNNGTYDYRGVYFTQYRSYDYFYDSSNTNQDDNGFLTNTIYWFSYDPIEWDILTESSGKALIIANLILDSQEYYPNSSIEAFSHNGGTGYANNYELSAIRKFLNDNFYNTAFNELQKALIETTTVDNSVASIGESPNSYVCNNTNDKMFLLSYKEATTYYKISTAIQAYGSDYAKCQGLSVSPYGFSYWWLRSPANFNGKQAYSVYNDGRVGEYYSVYYIDWGVRPACWINL